MGGGGGGELRLTLTARTPANLRKIEYGITFFCRAVTRAFAAVWTSRVISWGVPWVVSLTSWEAVAGESAV